MPEMSSYPPGTPAWVDLRTPDVEDARRFYGGVFGWDSEPADPEHHDSTMFMLRGKRVAGVGQQPSDGGEPGWTTYINVDDTAATTARAQAEGATVVQAPHDVGDGTRVAGFVDPVGATIGIWELGPDHGSQLVNEPNTLCWNELATRDIDTARDFYRAVFGWGVRTNPFEGTVYTEWKVGDHSVGGMIQMTDEWPDDVGSHWMTYFAVDDCDASTDHAEELGGKVLDPPIDIPPGRFAVLNDPQGAVFSILEMAEE
ncbi:MAG TPA: VOC family protein [Acidimicrobiia bacterium]|nr:VOC family protein [Acidimicrobiia bacterium]